MEKPQPPAVPPAAAVPKKSSYWRRAGGGSLATSLVIHGALLAIAVVWIFQIIPPDPVKVVDFSSRSAGGGSAGQTQKNEKRRTSMAKANASRVAVTNLESDLALPEPAMSSDLSMLGALGSALSGGMGSSGSGGGMGGGSGKGIGTGTGSGLAGIGGGSGNPFGIIDPNANALVGTFFDLKQDENRKPTNISNEQTREVIREFVNSGWNEKSLSRKYYQAPQRLNQTKIYIPLMQAEGAPAAFSCEKEVQPSRWVIVYRGTVSPPKNGKFRFVGAGDDVLVVRFNNKVVFDHGFYSGATGLHLSGGMIPVMKGEGGDRGREREMRDSPMKIPVTFYQYDTTRNWNGAIGGLAVGPEFEAKAGMSYPIEILISEIPGGLFCASLLIEEIGAKYEKASNGSPILPLFRLDSLTPRKAESDNAPPYDPKGLVWKLVDKGRLAF